jgi:predicted O-linked N-acetylglucosamine transferase (SPINDLY family)
MTRGEPSSIASADFRRALKLHQEGKLDEAEPLYRRVLAEAPSHADSLHLLGVVRMQKGDAAQAATLIRQALSFAPDMAIAHSNLGNALKELSRPEEALASYARAVELRPDFAEAWFNRGVVFMRLGCAAEAVSSYERALSARPNYVEALNNLGNALLALGRTEEAFESYESAVRSEPRFMQAWYNRGKALTMLQRPQEALASFERVLELNPESFEAMARRGDVLQDLGRAQEAVASYDRALVIRPDLLDVLDGKARALLDLNRNAESAATFEKLLDLAPKHDYALGLQFHAQLLDCDWSEYRELKTRIAADVARGERRDAPFSFLAHSDDAPAQKSCARVYAADKYPPQRPLCGDARYRHERIRIAYISSDFADHPVGHLIADLVGRHDRKRFELFGISLAHGGEDRGFFAFERCMSVWKMSDKEIALLLKESEIDIAVDLNGYTQGRRTGIFSHRGATLQVNYLGYPGTMGSEYFDYIVADHHLVTTADEGHYSEKIVRLPDAYIASARRELAPARPRSAYGLPEDGFVFCCFNNSYKISPQVFDTWMRLLDRVPASVLWLRDHGDAARRNLIRESEHRGVAAKRLIFAPRLDRDEHLARYAAADLFLDTLPYNAHATTLEALQAGLPVVTAMGGSFASRVAGSLLYAVGLPELIARNLAEYEALALRLASEPQSLTALRSQLARNAGHAPLFDIERFCRHLEAIYLAMHARSMRGEGPESFDIPPFAR